MGWVFRCNPKKYDLDTYLSRHPLLIYWSTPIYKQDIKNGDLVFIWRTGKSFPGIVAEGHVVEEPVPKSQIKHPETQGEDLWLEPPTSADRYVTGIQLHRVRLDETQGMVTRSTVMAHDILRDAPIITVPQSTVIKFTLEQENALRQLWGNSLAIPIGENGTLEGARKLRAHYVRERSPRLRDDKLGEMRSRFGTLHCELCHYDSVKFYPIDMQDRIFEVHHRRPLSESVSPVATKLADLAVLCANCHRAVHVTEKVDENFARLVAYFGTKGV